MNATEKRWLAQLAAGKSVAQIAKAEKFSVGTMRVYLHNMYKRMGVHNRAQAVAHYLLTTATAPLPAMLILTTSEVKLALAAITNHMTGLHLGSLSKTRQQATIRLGDKLQHWLEKND